LTSDSNSPCTIFYSEGNFEIGPRFQGFLADFVLRMHRNGQNSTSGQIFNPKFEIPMGSFLYDYEFWYQDLWMFWASKNSLCNAKFWEYWSL